MCKCAPPVSVRSACASSSFVFSLFNLQVDFDAPLGYKEPERHYQPEDSSVWNFTITSSSSVLNNIEGVSVKHGMGIKKLNSSFADSYILQMNPSTKIEANIPVWY